MRKIPSAIDVFGVPSEDAEQMAVIEWAELQAGRWPELAMLYHIPNGGKRGKIEAARFKAMGVKAGVPDLCLPVARGGYHGLYIEMKRREGGRLSADQAEWIGSLRREGYCAYRCDGCRDAQLVLEAYLRGQMRRDDEGCPCST